MKAAGLIFDNSPHYLDHLGPFCALKGWPLILCDPDLADIARHFYPDLQIIEQDVLELKDLLKKQTIVSCTPRLEALLNIPIFNTLWLPHGNSDKGQIKPWLGTFAKSTLRNTKVSMKISACRSSLLKSKRPFSTPPHGKILKTIVLFGKAYLSWPKDCPMPSTSL